MTTKSKGESIRQKLNTISKKLGVKYANIETSFLIERLVARLVANKELSKRLVFKGGFVGLKVYDSPRYTVDLDALLVKSNVESTLQLTEKCAETDLDDGVWFQYEGQVDLATQGEYGGIRQIYRAGIGRVLKNIKKAQIIHFDLGVGDPVTPAPKELEVSSLVLKGEAMSWLVYPIETIVAEKLHALIDHGDTNSRSKDVYDLSIFLQKVDAKVLREALIKCFDYRETELPPNIEKALKQINTVRLKKGWGTALVSVANAPSFDEAFDVVINQMAQLEKNFR